MKNIPYPEIKTSDFLFNLFNFRASEKIERFNAAAGLILLYERLYASKARSGTLHSFPSENVLNDLVKKDELTKLYTSKFVKENGREDYLALKKYTSFDFYKYIEINPECPYCWIKNVEQLDHYLPKDVYPILSVSTLNLIPSCASCNNLKKTLSGEDLFIHPYFDEISDYDWLYMKIIFNDYGIAFDFEVSVPTDIKNHQSYDKKLNFQMTKLGIFDIYIGKANVFHHSNIGAFKMIMDDYGEASFRKIIKKYYDDASIMNRNSFESAFYRAIYTLDDYALYFSYSS